MDLREKNVLKLDKTNYQTQLILNKENPKTLKLTFEVPTDGYYEPSSESNSNKFPLQFKYDFSSDNRTLTLTFSDNYNVFKESYENTIIEFIVTIPERHETYRSVVEKGKLFKVILKCVSVTENDKTNNIETVSFDSSIRLYNN